MSLHHAMPPFRKALTKKASQPPNRDGHQADRLCTVIAHAPISRVDADLPMSMSMSMPNRKRAALPPSAPIGCNR